MVSVCLSSDALLQHLPSYLGFSYLGRGVSLHGCSSKVQPLLLTLNEGYLLTAALPDLQHGIASLGSPAPAQPRLLGLGVGPPGHCPWPRAWGCSSLPLPLAWAWGVGYLLPAAAAPDLGRQVIPLVAAPDLRRWVSFLGCPPGPRTQCSSFRPFLCRHSLVLSATAPDLRRGVTPLGRRPSRMGSSQLLPLTSNVGWILSAAL